MSFNFFQNLGQALAFFLFGKGWEIHVTPLTNQTIHFNIIQFLVKFQLDFVCQRARNAYITLTNPTIQFNISKESFRELVTDWLTRQGNNDRTWVGKKSQICQRCHHFLGLLPCPPTYISICTKSTFAMSTMTHL